MPLKSLENLLNPNANPDLGDIVRRARDMDELATALQRSLPQDQAGSIRSANVRDNGELVVLAASPAWAARLRFEADRLMAAARETGAEVNACTVRVERGS
jgi:hypothetical protein